MRKTRFFLTWIQRLHSKNNCPVQSSEDTGDCTYSSVFCLRKHKVVQASFSAYQTEFRHKKGVEDFVEIRNYPEVPEIIIIIVQPVVRSTIPVSYVFWLHSLSS
jgi:hypothetical protein